MQKRFFVKRIFTYFLTMLVPTVIIFGMVFYIMLGNTQVKLKSDLDNSLAIANYNLDLIISNLAYQNDLMTTSPEYALSLKRLLNEDEIEYNNLIFLKSIRAVLTSMVESHKYVDSIYIYLDGAGKFFSSATGVESLATFYDTTWYEKVRNLMRFGDASDRWAETRILKKASFEKGREFISLYQRMKFIDGYIIINIDPEKLNENLNTIFNRQDTSLYILNKDQDILVANTIGENRAAAFRTELVSILAKTKPAGEWTRVGNEKVLICSTEYWDYSLKLVAVASRRALWARLLPIGGTFGIAFIANCLLVFLLAYGVTRRNFKQISHVIDTFNNAERGIYPEAQVVTTVNDEYEVIMNNIVNMFINTTYLNSQLEQKQYKQKVAELTALQAQINPHFLFNTLQTVNFELQRHKIEDRTDVSVIVRELSEILKYALMPSTQFVPVKQEIAYLKRYIGIQKFRFNDTLVVYYQVEDGILEFPIPRLILQPLVENSILHGVRNTEKAGYIKIKIQQHEDALQFVVTDNGIGMDREEVAKLNQQIMNENTESIGLTNVNQRLRLHYGEGSALHIRSKRGWGTCIYFRIPKK